MTGLGSFTDDDLRQEALDYVLEGKVRPTELFAIPRAVSGNDPTDSVAFDWMVRNYSTIKSRVPAMMMAYMPFSASGCSLDVLARARAFFEQLEHQVDGTLANLEKIEDSVTDCALLREREISSVASFLTGVPQVEAEALQPVGP